MIVKSGEGKINEFLGVTFDVLAVGEMSMVTKMNFKKGDIVPFHRHASEQSGYVISGSLRFIFGDFHFMRYVRCLDVGVECLGFGEVMMQVSVIPRAGPA